MSLKAAPTSWETVSLDLGAKAAWNPFHYTDPKADALMQEIRTGSAAQSATAAKELNAYVVDQAWFAPWYRPQAVYATDANTRVAVQAGNAYPYLWNFVPTK
jgi:peptide/nickel transport system substrate-binding protein